MELVKYPDPILARPAAEVVDFDDNLMQIISGMLELMYSHKGLGLAGPQAGIGRQVIVLNASEGPGGEMVLINPQIVDSSGEVKFEEGCLSFPGIYAKIVRPEQISCLTNTPDGRQVSFDCDGLLARVVQHEIDHLKGVLLPDRMSPAERKAHQRALRKMRKDYEG